MDRIEMSGPIGPEESFLLRGQLEPLTSVLRPMVTVDLSAVEEIHPSIVSVLIRQHRQARRQAGTVRVVAPMSAAAAAVLSQIGLIEVDA